MTAEQIKIKLLELINEMDETREQQLLKAVLLSVVAAFISDNIEMFAKCAMAFTKQYINQREYENWVNNG